MVLEKTLETPLDSKEIQLVYSKGDQSWVFIGRTDAKAETPILWPLFGFFVCLFYFSESSRLSFVKREMRGPV